MKRIASEVGRHIQRGHCHLYSVETVRYEQNCIVVQNMLTEKKHNRDRSRVTTTTRRDTQRTRDISLWYGYVASL